MSNKVDKIFEELMCDFWGFLKNKEQELEVDYQKVLSIACLNDNDNIDLSLVTDTIRNNQNKRVEEHSLKKYLFMKAFEKLAKKHSSTSIFQLDCYNYWKEELKKENPNLTNRFVKS